MQQQQSLLLGATWLLSFGQAISASLIIPLCSCGHAIVFLLCIAGMYFHAYGCQLTSWSASSVAVHLTLLTAEYEYGHARFYDMYCQAGFTTVMIKRPTYKTEREARNLV